MPALVGAQDLVLELLPSLAGYAPYLGLADRDDQALPQPRGGGPFVVIWTSLDETVVNSAGMAEGIIAGGLQVSGFGGLCTFEFVNVS